MKALEGEYFIFGAGRLIKFSLEAEVVSGVVNARLSSGCVAGIRAEVAALRCGVKIERHAGVRTARFTQCIFLVLLGISGKATSLADGSHPATRRSCLPQRT